VEGKREKYSAYGKKRTFSIGSALDRRKCEVRVKEAGCKEKGKRGTWGKGEEMLRKRGLCI